jgi:SIR2-like domain
MRRRLFILGAGASYGAGLPDGGRLPSHVMSYLTGPYEIVRHRAPWDYFAPLTDILMRVVFQEQSTGRPQWTWPLDRVFARMLELMEADPKRFALPFQLLHQAVAEVLYCRSCHGGRTEAYRRFVEALDPTDVVLTFNWDVCLEIALHEVKRPFSHALVGSPPIDRPWILKLHGSVDYLVLLRESYDGQQTQTFDLPNLVDSLDVRPPPLVWTGQGWAPWASNAAPPVQPSTPHMIHEATRLRTYDLEGDFEDDYPMLYPDDDESSPRIASFELVLNPDEGSTSQQPQHSDADPADSSLDIEDDGSWQAPDVRPYRLTESIQPPPSFLMLSPATPEWVYQWYYDRVLSCVYQVVGDIDQIFVVGYSFPPYDRRVFGLLKDVVARASHPPVDIVNPGASDLPQDILKSIFGRQRLHNNAFQEFPWSKRGV